MASKKDDHGFLCKIKSFFKSEKEKDGDSSGYDYEADHERDIARTFLLSHRRQSAEAEKFKDALVRATETDLRFKASVLSASENSEDATENTNALLEYIKDMSGVLILCSEDLVKLLNNPKTQETQVDIQISGDDVHLDAKILSSGIASSDVVKRKILMLKLPNDNVSNPDCLADQNVISLSKENLDRSDPNKLLHEIWVRDDIIPGLKQLMNRRLISQSSIGN